MWSNSPRPRLKTAFAMVIVFLLALLSNYKKKKERKEEIKSRPTVTEDEGQGDRVHFNLTRSSFTNAISVTHRMRPVIDSALITENGA